MNKNALITCNFCCSFFRVSRYSLTVLLSLILLSDAVGAKAGSLQNSSPKISPEILLDKYRDNLPSLADGDKQVLLKSYQNQQQIYIAQQPASTPSIPLNPEQQKLYEQGLKLVQEAQELKEKGTKETYNQALDKYQQALKIAQELGLRLEEADINLKIGIVYVIFSENVEALKYFNQFLNISRELKLPILEASALTVIAQSYTRTGKPREALTYLKQAESIFRAEKRLDAVASVLISMAAVYTGLGEIPQTLEPLNQALIIYRDTLKDLPQKATVLNQIGFSYAQMGEPQKALKYYEQALEIQQKSQDLLSAKAETLRNIGSLYHQLGKSEEGLNYLNQASKIQQEKGLLIAEGLTIQTIADIHTSQGDYQKSIEHHKQAITLFQKGGNAALESITILRIISIYKNYIGDHQKALEFIDEALKLDKNVTGDIERYANSLNQKADIYTSQGDYQQALEIYNEVLDIAIATKNKSIEARTLSNMASLYELLGDYDLSSKNYKQALQIYRQIPDKPFELMLLPAIGQLYMTKEDYPEAIKYYNQVLSLSREQNNYQFEIIGLMGLARVYELQKDFPKALKNAEAMLALSQKHANKYSEAGALSLIGIINRTKGDYKQSLTNHQKVLSQYRLLGVRKLEAQTLNNISLTYGLSKQYQQAIATLNEEIKLRRELKDTTGEADALYLIAINQRKLGNLEAAHPNIQAAIEIVESIRGKVESKELRTSYFATVQNYYKFYIDLLMQLHKKDPKKLCEFNIEKLKIKNRCDAVALHLSERSRARALIELLEEARVNIRQGINPQLLIEESRLRNKIDVQEKRRLELASEEKTTAQAEKLNKEIENLLSQYRDLQTQINASNPKYKALKSPTPLTLSEIQQQLDKDTILLQYSLGKERSYLWLITPNSLQSYELPKEEEIETAAKDLYDYLKSTRMSTDLGLQIEPITRSASKLSKLILAPVAKQLGQKRLVIVADGALQSIPFAALTDPETLAKGSDYQPLIVNHEIVNLPSASTIAIQRQELRKPAPKTLAILANPVFTKNDSNDRNLSLDESEAKRAIRDMNLEDIIPLPGTQDEADAIIALVPQEEERLSAFRTDANYAWITSPKLSNYRYLHFATHGFLNSVNPELSGIVLSLVDKQGNPQKKGFLRLNDLFNLNFPAELVVLSACQTGLGKEVKGEGLIGLTRGLMYAGAERVTVSLWSVDDGATAVLMKEFYTQILKHKKSPAAALQAAQKSLWQQQRWRDPHYWSAFTLQGEWRD